MPRKISSLLIAFTIFLVACKKGNNSPASSSKILFSAQVTATSIVQMFSINPDGSELTQVTHFTDFIPLQDMAWSSDHSKIVYNKGAQIFVMNADGSNVVQLTDNNTVSYGGRFSPDGRSIVYTTRVASPAGAPYSTTSQLAIMNASTGAGKTQITNLCTAAYKYRDAEIGTWSPDGSKIAFITIVQNGNGIEIYTINADGSGLKLIVPDQYPSSPETLTYSPDGSTLMFQNFAGTTSIEGAYTASAATGANLKFLFSYSVPANSLASMSPSYSPDGSQIVAGSYKDNPKGDLYIVNTDGTIAKRLTNGGYDLIYNTAWR